jgi:4-amino-4-deoxy-L-arabinose transferase-like glycosyltransferase
MNKNILKKDVRVDILILFAILVVAVILRFIHLRTAPDWYMDEGEFIRFADNLSKGNFDILGVRDSLLLIGRLPMFLWVLAATFKVFGTDILVLRSLTALCSVAIIVIVYVFVRQALGRKAAIYSALLLAIMPEYIYYNRMGFTYNWTSLWMLFSLFAVWKYLQQDHRRWLVIACLSAGVALASDYLGVISVLVIILVLILFHPRNLKYAFLMGLPVIISIVPGFLHSPGFTLHDLLIPFSMAKHGEGGIGYQLSLMLQAYPVMFLRQPWIVLGIVGLFLLPDQRLKGLILLQLCGMLVLISFSRDLSAHYLLPIWPLVIIGLGHFMEKTVTFFFTTVKSLIVNLKIAPQWLDNGPFKSILGSIGSTVLVFCFVFLPVSYMIILDSKGFLIEPINPSIVLSQVVWESLYIPADDAQDIAKKISENLSPEDIVIAPSTIYWMLPSKAVDFRSVYAYELAKKGLGNSAISLDRYIENISMSNAKYVVLHDASLYSGIDSPEISSSLKEISDWPILIDRRGVQLFCNPAYCQ